MPAAGGLQWPSSLCLPAGNNSYLKNNNKKKKKISISSGLLVPSGPGGEMVDVFELYALVSSRQAGKRGPLRKHTPTTTASPPWPGAGQGQAPDPSGTGLPRTWPRFCCRPYPQCPPLGREGLFASCWTLRGLLLRASVSPSAE